jgi:ferredoxin
VREPKRQGGPIVDVEVVPELCMNFRNCVRIARGAFVTDPQTGKTRAALWQKVDPEQVWRAGWSCPSGAIRVKTAEGYVVPRWDEIAHWESERHRAAALPRPGEPTDSW